LPDDSERGRTLCEQVQGTHNTYQNFVWENGILSRYSI